MLKTDFLNPPREFEVKGHTIKDHGKIHLQDADMITLLTESGKECDMVARDWGFYLGPSLNSRLVNEGFKVALVINEQKQLYIHAVDTERLDEFKAYLKTGQNNTLVCWLDEWLPKS